MTDDKLRAALEQAEGHQPVGVRLHDGTYDEDDEECGVCSEDWPCLVSRLAAALAASATDEGPNYETWVGRVADAIHETCRLEWQAIAAVDPGRQVTQHMADAHYGQAHDLVRRLNLARPAVPALDVRAPTFRAAVAAVFAAPGDFGPAQGYYGGDIDHFIDMLDAALSENHR